MRQYRGHTAGVNCVKVAPNDNWIASADGDNNILIWDLRKADNKAHLQGHTAKVTGLSFCSNGKLLASGSLDGSIRLWDTGALRVGKPGNRYVPTRTCRVLTSFLTKNTPVFDVKFSPFNLLVGFGAYDRPH